MRLVRAAIICWLIYLKHFDLAVGLKLLAWLAFQAGRAHVRYIFR